VRRMRSPSLKCWRPGPPFTLIRRLCGVGRPAKHSGLLLTGVGGGVCGGVRKVLEVWRSIPRVGAGEIENFRRQRCVQTSFTAKQ